MMSDSEDEEDQMEVDEVQQDDIPLDRNEANFKARPYQDQLLEYVIKENTIIYLPTGAGKTFIALMAMRHFSKDLSKSLDDGGKRTIFLANTQVLTRQQADSIKRATAFRTSVYTGDLNVDNWRRDKWREEFEKYQVIVATCQIILDTIRHGFLKISEINLLIFDECHHGRGDHPMHQLMSHFQYYKVCDQPRVIGLTGMLVSGAVAAQTVVREIEALENTFHSTIRTVKTFNDFDNVLVFSTKPKESILSFNNIPTPLVQIFTRYVAEVLDMLTDYDLVQPESSQNLIKSQLKPPQKKIKKVFNDFIYQLSDMGIYGGSIAILSVIVELELSKRGADSISLKKLIRLCITKAEHMRKLLILEMAEEEEMIEGDLIMKYSSNKVKALIDYVEKHLSKTNPNDMKCLIFVQRRYTAKVLYHVIKRYANSKFDEFPVRPDFIVGQVGLPESIESILESKWQRNVLEKFKKNETNLIVASSVLEEGVDFQQCNIVITYDVPQTFRSYIQTKGRARMETSNYVMMTPSQEHMKIIVKIDEYRKVDIALKNCLINKVIDRQAPLKDDISREVYENSDIKPFKIASGACLEALSVVPLLHRYCSMLPNDNFTVSTITWTNRVVSELQHEISILMPTQSTIKEKITGDILPTIKQAKRSAAMKACIKLYENGELTQQLLPFSKQKKIESVEPIYFKHWDKYAGDNKTAGTRQNNRSHEMSFPEETIGCTPIIGQACYLYIIEMKAGFTLTDDNHGDLTFQQLLNENRNFGLLTTKRLPKLATMPFFLSLGQVNVNLLENPIEIVLNNSTEMKQLRNFHVMIFRDLLKIWKSFFVYDFDNEENSLFLTATRDESIDWEVIRNFQNLPPSREKSDCERNQMQFKPADYLHKVVSPWYRADTEANRVYIVTKVNENLTPESPFPNTDFDSYKDYFTKRYFMTTFHNQQFMIEVKGVTCNLKRLFPGDGEDGGTKKNWHKLTENLIPEFCHNYGFPGVLWLKATIIPSFLHRLHTVLLAENFRQKILRHCGLKDLNGTSESLDVDLFRKKKVTKSDDKNIRASIIVPDPNKTESVSASSCPHLGDTIDTPWKGIDEPVELQRQYDTIFQVDIDYYFKFISGSVENLHEMLNDDEPNPWDEPPNKRMAICDTEYTQKMTIKLLNKNISVPQQKDILRAITTRKSCDVFDMERFEVLGDSFLKFAVSLFLLKNHEDWHEGFLTAVKSTIVSNRNLFYCGNDIGLSKIMKIFEFSPRDDWLPPLITVPRAIQEIMKTKKISALTLYKLNLTKAEILSGNLSEETFLNFIQTFCSDEGRGDLNSPMQCFVAQQNIPDKVVADCVESVLGVCVNSIGIQNSLSMLQFFNILPRNADLQNLMNSEKKSPRLRTNITDKEIDEFLINIEDLEQSLGYRFKDRGYILQALTHPSFPTNVLTGCYQQLEFFGDAVLDFLISSYIFENCPNMEPGELTDLRSALVNNITLACICVRQKFHLFILAQNSVLSESIANFALFQEKNKHQITDQVQLLVEEDALKISEFIDVPKSLGDIFEAIIGAVYLDSGNNLEITWKIIYDLMQNEIIEFMRDVPIQVVRRLQEWPGANPTYSPAHVADDVVVVTVKFTRVDKILSVNGFGKNSDNAKRAAAKHALQLLLQS